VLRQDRRRRRQVALTAPCVSLTSDDVDVVRHRLGHALLLERIERVAGSAEQDRDVATVGQLASELLAPCTSDGAHVGAGVGEVVGAWLADLGARPRDHLGTLLGGGLVGRHQRLTGVGVADDDVEVTGGEAADVGDRLLRVEVGVGVADLADLGVRQRLQDELHLEQLAGDVATEAVGQADLQLTAAAGLAAVVLPALEGLVVVDLHRGPADRGEGDVARPLFTRQARRTGGAGVDEGRVGVVGLAVLTVFERAAPVARADRATGVGGGGAGVGGCRGLGRCRGLGGCRRVVATGLGGGAGGGLVGGAGVVVVSAARGNDDAERARERCDLAISGHGFPPVVRMPGVAMASPLVVGAVCPWCSTEGLIGRCAPAPVVGRRVVRPRRRRCTCEVTVAASGDR
jgi:hypothetical protein